MARGASGRRPRPLFGLALQGAAASGEVIENGFRREDEAPGSGGDSDENVDVERGNRFQIKLRTDRTIDGITLDYSIRLHLVDDLDDFLDIHA